MKHISLLKYLFLFQGENVQIVSGFFKHIVHYCYIVTYHELLAPIELLVPVDRPFPSLPSSILLSRGFRLVILNAL